MTKKSAKTIFLLVVAGALGYSLATMRLGAPRRTEKSLVAPDFTFRDLSGKPVSLSDFKGDVVLVDFWATWCGPCQEELPELKALYAKYKSRGFELVAVSMDTMGSIAVAPYAKKNGLAFPVLVSGGEPPEGYSVYGLPMAFLIDRQGLIAQEYIGPQSFDDLARDIEGLLAR